MGYKNDTEELKQFALELYRKIKRNGRPVFLCVGSDKFVLDSLGPIIAEKLKKQYNINAYVYGGLDFNVNANNLMQVVNYIETEHPNSFLILIDATLGDNVGEVELRNGSFAGLGRCLPIKKIGLCSILGVVAKKSHDFNLNSTRLKTVVDLAEFITKGCAMVISYYDSLLGVEKRKIMCINNQN